MKKHNKKKDKDKKHKYTSGDAQYILTIVKQLGSDANLKNLFPKVLKKMKQEEIILSLYELERTGFIRMEQKGKIKILRCEIETRQTKSSKFLFVKLDY